MIDPWADDAGKPRDDAWWPLQSFLLGAQDVLLAALAGPADKGPCKCCSEAWHTTWQHKPYRMFVPYAFSAQPQHPSDDSRDYFDSAFYQQE